VLGSVLNSGYRSDIAPATARLPQPAGEAARDSIAAAAQVAQQAGPRGAALLEQAEHAFVSGLSTALLVGACVLFIASVLVALLAPRREEVEHAEQTDSDRRSAATPLSVAK
jgi:hypothetical protein